MFEAVKYLKFEAIDSFKRKEKKLKLLVIMVSYFCNFPAASTNVGTLYLHYLLSYVLLLTLVKFHCN